MFCQQNHYWELGVVPYCRALSRNAGRCFVMLGVVPYSRALSRDGGCFRALSRNAGRRLVMLSVTVRLGAVP